MADQYSIAEARQNLASLVHDVERKGAVELTRRGRPVAVLMSLDEFRRLRGADASFVERLLAFRGDCAEDLVEIEGDEFEDLRDGELGRDVER